MPPAPTAVSLTTLLSELAQAMATQQSRLDQDYLARLAACLPLLRAAQAAGYEALAQMLAPTILLLHNTEIETQMRLAGSLETQTAVRVQPLDIGFMRRYAYAGFAQNTLQLRVERIPLPPGSRP
jgi:hypothetical protein